MFKGIITRWNFLVRGLFNGALSDAEII